MTISPILCLKFEICTLARHRVDVIFSNKFTILLQMSKKISSSKPRSSACAKQSVGWELKTPQCGPQFFKHFQQFQGKQWPSLFCHCWFKALLGMSLKKVTSLGSNLASVTDLKRIETPHSLCCDFGGYKTFTTRWSGGRVQVWVQVRAPAGHLAITPEGCSRRQSKV